MAPLTVDPAALDSAGAAVVAAGEGLGSVVSTLSTALGGCSGMAGDDPAGAAFGRSYDRSASKLLDSMATTRNGLCRLGDGVRMSAHNYSLAEANSNVSAHGEPLPVPPPTGPVPAGSTPSAVGSGVEAPAGWGWVAPFIGMIWPNGDSAKLRAGAAAWISAGTNFEVSEIASTAGQMSTIGAQQIPEGPAIAAAFGDAGRSSAAILQQSLGIATQLTSYAAKVDQAQAAILDLLSRICDPMTGLKEVWEFLTDQDEDEIKKIANDIRVIVNQFTAEVDALRQQITTAVAEAETILTTMGRYAGKEWDQFLHGTEVGRALNQVGQFGKGLGEEAGGLVKDGWTYGLVRAAVDPKGWCHSWEQMAEGMAPLVGLGGDHAPGVAQAWKDLGKNAVHWDEWKTNPAEAAGKSTFDIASLFVPGGGEGAAAAKCAHVAADAAEAAAKTAPREATLSRALGDAAKPGVPASAAHAPHIEALPHDKPAIPHDAPAPHSELPGGRPEPAPAPKDAPAHPGPSPHGPVESKSPSTGGSLPAEGPKPLSEPSDPGHGPPPPPGGSPPPPGGSPPPPGQGPPPPEPHPPHPSGDGSLPPAPPAEPPPMAATPCGEGPPATAEPPHPAAASPLGEGSPPTGSPHQPLPSTPSAEGHLPSTEEPRSAASIASGDGSAAADKVPQLATVGSNLAHLPLSEEASTTAATAANAPLPAAAGSAELAPRATHEAEPGSAVSPGRPNSLPTTGQPHGLPLTHTPRLRSASPAEPLAVHPHGEGSGDHPSGEPPHGGKPSVPGDGGGPHATDVSPDHGTHHGGEFVGPYRLPAPELVTPLSDGAFFWSGRTSEGVGIGPQSAGGNGAADLFAASRHGTTLEGLLERNGVKPPKFDFDDLAAQKWWSRVSEMYAQNARGEVYAVVGSNLRPGSVWETVELPRLMNNPNVTKIVSVDPETGSQQTLLER